MGPPLPFPRPTASRGCNQPGPGRVQAEYDWRTPAVRDLAHGDPKPPRPWRRAWPWPLAAPVGVAVQCRGVSRLQGEVEFGVLGPLEVRVAGRPVAVPGARQRALLAALLLRRGTVVAFDRLIDDVFGEQPPDEARNALQTYAARLRHALGPAAGVVVTRAPGYALEVPGDAVDLERFTVLLVRAREAQSPAAALALVEEALALWRGPAYGEFAETFARGEALRLQELRLAAREDCATLLVRLGRLAEATAALEAIVAEEPWRERAVELLVTALAQAGQARHALAAYAGYRDRLRDELGLDPSPKLRRLEQQVLRAEVEPVQPRPARPERRVPPARATSFVGREQELTLVRETLACGRLVTLVGPGGVGKTRLAHQAAAAGPVWWVDLAPLRDPDAIPHAVADALDLDVQPGTPLLDSLHAWARGARGLLVVDNCEHLLAAVAGIAQELLAVPSQVRLLATSRERLGVDGEQVLVVRPLEVPEPDAQEVGIPSVRLFCDRARAADPDFAPSPEVIQRVGDVCRALDGLPLAIELAAARIGTLTVDDLADRLDARFELLRATHRGGDARHHTLRGVVDWSFDLLTPEQQRLFLRLSVFAAAFDIDAAEQVVADEDLPAGRVADLVAGLADRSMLTRPGHTGVGRYRMLETLRAYAAARLPAAEADRFRRRHAAFMVDLAERAEAGLYGPDEPAWARRVEAWLDDLRAAWSWARDAGEVDVAVRLAAALTRYGYWGVRPDILAWGAWPRSPPPATWPGSPSPPPTRRWSCPTAATTRPPAPSPARRWWPPAPRPTPPPSPWRGSPRGRRWSTSTPPPPRPRWRRHADVRRRSATGSWPAPPSPPRSRSAAGTARPTRRSPCSGTPSSIGAAAATAGSSSPRCATSLSCWPAPAGTRPPSPLPRPCSCRLRASPTAPRPNGSRPRSPPSAGESATPPTPAHGRQERPERSMKRPTRPYACWIPTSERSDASQGPIGELDQHASPAHPGLPNPTIGISMVAISARSRHASGAAAPPPLTTLVVNSGLCGQGQL